MDIVYLAKYNREIFKIIIIGVSSRESKEGSFFHVYNKVKELYGCMALYTVKNISYIYRGNSAI